MQDGAGHCLPRLYTDLADWFPLLTPPEDYAEEAKLLSSNIGEIGLMAGATLLGMPLPLAAVQILYVNLATDGLPALALAVDPPDSDLMHRRPRNPRTGIFTRPVITLISVGGVWSAVVNLLRPRDGTAAPGRYR